jgi:hypothetical protein
LYSELTARAAAEDSSIARIVRRLLAKTLGLHAVQTAGEQERA